MFDGYNIVDEADLVAAVAKPFIGKGAAKSEGATAPVQELS